MFRPTMFWRILWQLLAASRGRLTLALVALTTGAAICSALLTLNMDAERKLTREFRTLGANLIVAPPAIGGDGALAGVDIMDRIAALKAPEMVAAAPYLYVVARSGAQPVILAGTGFDQVAGMSSWWEVKGARISARSDHARCLVGSAVARELGLGPGSQLTLQAGDRQASLTVSGIVSTGGAEDNQILASLEVAQQLAGLPGRVSLVQLSVLGSSSQMEALTSRLAAALPALEVRPVRQLAAAEGMILGRIRSLIFWTVALILALTSLVVFAAMAGFAMERSKDVGLMKALGGGVPRIMHLFQAEAAVLGLVGGTLGFAGGTMLARWIGASAFGIVTQPRLVVLPLTIALAVVVALAGAFPLRMLGRVRPAIILRGE